MDSGESERRSLRAHLDTLWKAAEAESHTSVPPEARGFLEEYLGLPEPTMYPDEDDIRAVMDEFIQHGLPSWKRCFDRGRRHGEALQRTRRALTAMRSARPRVYGKAQAKRLLLLRFMAERVVPWANRHERSFDTGGHSIPCDQVYAEWKKEHPEYRGSAQALERAYRRVRNDRGVCELYFDSEFRDRATLAEALQPTLTWLEAGGLRPEDVFVKTVAHHNPRLADDAHWMLSEAQVLRRANEVEGIDPATRKRNEVRAEAFERAAQALTRASQVKEWSSIFAKFPPSAGRALARAVVHKCRLTEGFVAYPRETVFCERPRCHRCKVGSKLVKVGFGLQEDLVELTAAGAGERHRRRLDESAQNWRKLFEFANRRSRG